MRAVIFSYALASGGVDNIYPHTFVKICVLILFLWDTD